MTPFEELGYTKDTVFICMDECSELYEQKVKLKRDDGSHYPYFQPLESIFSNETYCLLLSDLMLCPAHEYRRIRYDHLWKLVKAFEEGTEFYYMINQEECKLVITIDDLIRYQYRLFIKE